MLKMTWQEAEQLTQSDKNVITAKQAASLLGYNDTSHLNRLRARKDNFPKPIGMYSKTGGHQYLYSKAEIIAFKKTTRLIRKPLQTELTPEEAARLIEINGIMAEFHIPSRSRFYNLVHSKPFAPQPVKQHGKKYWYLREEIKAWLNNEIKEEPAPRSTFDHDAALRFITGNDNPNTSKYGRARYLEAVTNRG